VLDPTVAVSYIFLRDELLSWTELLFNELFLHVVCLQLRRNILVQCDRRTSRWID